MTKPFCRTTAKEKSRRRADNLTRPFETAALIFRAAVSLRLHKPMTTCRDAVADWRLTEVKLPGEGGTKKRCKPRKKACSGAFWRPREDLNLRPHA